MKKIIQQAFFQLRNQPLLSVITVLGTALAIALIMVILIVYQAKTADYAPEVNRSRSLYVKWERTVYDKKDPNSAGHSRPSLWLVKEIFYPLTTPEAVTATYEGGEVLVGTVGSDEEMNTPLMLTDAAFWKVYQFRFLAGKPFTEADFQSGMKQAVIAKSVARRLFGGVENAIGKDILVNFAAYTVCGVSGYIEYKNKTQEKCNYCTIYQCISGFYKKNVELHLLLILAIDSLIYSFYVTILLCKKAPVFD